MASLASYRDGTGRVTSMAGEGGEQEASCLGLLFLSGGTRYRGGLASAGPARRGAS